MSQLSELISHLQKKELLTSELKDEIINFGIEYKLKFSELDKVTDVTIVPFGKFKGKLWADIVKFDPKYCTWALEKSFLKQEYKDHIKELMLPM